MDEILIKIIKIVGVIFLILLLMALYYGYKYDEFSSCKLEDKEAEMVMHSFIEPVAEHYMKYGAPASILEVEHLPYAVSSCDKKPRIIECREQRMRLSDDEKPEDVPYRRGESFFKKGEEYFGIGVGEVKPSYPPITYLQLAVRLNATICSAEIYLDKNTTRGYRYTESCGLAIRCRRGWKQ